MINSKELFFTAYKCVVHSPNANIGSYVKFEMLFLSSYGISKTCIKF
jgi:hypothetical protein